MHHLILQKLMPRKCQQLKKTPKQQRIKLHRRTTMKMLVKTNQGLKQEYLTFCSQQKAKLYNKDYLHVQHDKRGACSETFLHTNFLLKHHTKVEWNLRLILGNLFSSYKPIKYFFEISHVINDQVGALFYQRFVNMGVKNLPTESKIPKVKPLLYPSVSISFIILSKSYCF